MLRAWTFAAAIRHAAEAIRKGALRDAADASQVSRQSWDLLARMNALGLLTFDSQDAPPGGEGKERAYVTGFMRRERADAFVERLNARTDKVALAVHPCSQFQSLGRIPVTQNDDGSVYTRFPPYMSLKDHRWLRGEGGANLRATSDVVMVEGLDARLGRCAWKKGGLFRDVVQQLGKEAQL